MGNLKSVYLVLTKTPVKIDIPRIGYALSVGIPMFPRNVLLL